MMRLVRAQGKHPVCLQLKASNALAGQDLVSGQTDKASFFAVKANLAFFGGLVASNHGLERSEKTGRILDHTAEDKLVARLLVPGSQIKGHGSATHR